MECAIYNQTVVNGKFIDILRAVTDNGKRLSFSTRGAALDCIILFERKDNIGWDSRLFVKEVPISERC